ncbi:zinc ribbon domain-containing protein [Chloroflexota bacterium]
MPIYEYRCNKCHRRVSLFVRSFGEPWVGCPSCGHTDLNRLFSTFAIRAKSDQDIYEDILSDNKLVAGLERNDPKALVEWNQRISRGEGVSPEFDEMVERIEAGETLLTNKEETSEEL